jgi:hypothetical protein
MAKMSLSVHEDYWNNFEFLESDIEYLFNHLLESETPMNSKDITRMIVDVRIINEKKELAKQKRVETTLFLPKEKYEVNQRLSFPAFDLQEGVVMSIRDGNNPEIGEFAVVEIQFDDGSTKLFASGIEEHKLNNPIIIEDDDPFLDLDYVLKNYGKSIRKRIIKSLEASEDLVSIAGYWFPSSLLLDVNVGYLNLAEALLDMENGGPLTTESILEQIELPTNTNSQLTEFSMDYALQEDPRFDEVGPAGITQWYLKRLEPEFVQHTPDYLKCAYPQCEQESIKDELVMLENQVTDELESSEEKDVPDKSISIGLIYPHWRSGTLPLSDWVNSFFPTAYEAPRIRFTFIDEMTGKSFPGWVIRDEKYVYGLSEWYEEKNLIPGNLVTIKHGKNPGEVIVTAGKSKPKSDWVRTATVNDSGRISFAMQKQMVNMNLDERMAIFISNPEELDKLWSSGKHIPLEKLTILLIRELTKLNPQGHVHAQELYAAINLIRRCPPSPILILLSEKPWAEHLGDLYYRLNDLGLGGDVNE